MRIAVVGAAGQLGSELMRAFAGDEPIGLTHDSFEIEDAAAIAAMLEREQPELVVNTAAFHNVDRCEESPERAYAVNAIAVDRLAQACAKRDIALAHVSTDYVFDGATDRPYDEHDAARPQNTYGISKRAGELQLERRGSRHYIFRTSGLYAARGTSAKGKAFIERMLELAPGDAPMRVVDDIVFSPSYAAHVAHAIRDVVTRNAYGTYHVTNAGECSWHAFATEILAQAGFARSIEKTSSLAQSGGVRRPKYSALENRAMRELGLPPLPTWQRGIADYLAARGRKGPA